MTADPSRFSRTAARQRLHVLGHTLARTPAFPRPILVLLLLYLAVTLYLAFWLNVWIDEVYSLSTTSLSLPETFERAITFENQPPLYFVLLRLWRSVSTSPFFARVLSILCILAFLLLLTRFVQGLSARAPVFLVVSYTATSPLFIWAALEIRVYAMALLLGLLVLVSFDRLFFAPAPGRVSSGLRHAGAIALGLHAYPFVGFLIPGNLLFVMTNREHWPRWRQYLPALVLAGAVALPVVFWAGTVAGGVGDALPDVDPTLSLGAATRLVLEQLEEGLVPVYRLLRHSGLNLSSSSVTAVYWTTRVAVIGVLLLSLGGASTWRRLAQDARIRWVVVTAACFALQLIVMLMFVAPVAASIGVGRVRHTALLLVPSLLLLALIGAHASRARVFRGLLAILVLLNCLALVAEYRILAKHGDSRRVAAFLEEEVDASEAVLVFPSEDVLALRVYYRGDGRLEPIPEEPSLVRYEPGAFRLQDDSHVKQVLGSLGGEMPSLWVVYNRSYQEWGHLFDMGGKYLQTYLSSRYSTDREREFQHGVVVRRLVRKPDRP